VVCLGGTSDGKKSEDYAALLTIDGTGAVVSSALPPLPVSLDNFAAAYGDGFIYAAGGQHNGMPNRKAFRLKWPLPSSWFEAQTDAAWEELPDVPGPARVQPCAVVQKGAISSNFYLLGGFDPRYRKAVANGVYYDTRKGNWFATSLIQTPPQTPSVMEGGDATVETSGNGCLPSQGYIERALVGASAIPSGAAHVLCFGGVNKHIFEEALDRNYQLSDTTIQTAQRLAQLREEVY
jgi:N-acetylneuraminic acid mutarotase